MMKRLKILVMVRRTDLNRIGSILLSKRFAIGPISPRVRNRFRHSMTMAVTSRMRKPGRRRRHGRSARLVVARMPKGAAHWRPSRRDAAERGRDPNPFRSDEVELRRGRGSTAVTLVSVTVSDALRVITVLAPDCVMSPCSTDQLAKSRCAEPHRIRRAEAVDHVLAANAVLERQGVGASAEGRRAAFR